MKPRTNFFIAALLLAIGGTSFAAAHYVVAIAGQNTVTNPVTSPQQFYRLKQ